MDWMSAICEAHKKVDVEPYLVRTGSQLVWRPDPLVTRCGRESQHPTGVGTQTPDWEFEDQTRWWQDAVQKASTLQSGPSDPRLSSPIERERTRLWPIEWGSICCSSVRSPTPSHTRPFQIKWEVYFSKNCVAPLVSLLWFSMYMSIVAYVLCGYTALPCDQVFHNNPTLSTPSVLSISTLILLLIIIIIIIIIIH